MNTNTFETLKERYEQGYRCIRTDMERDTMNIYLKNFETEQVDSLMSNNQEEINRINQYISSMTEK